MQEILLLLPGATDGKSFPYLYYLDFGDHQLAGSSQR